VIKLNRSSEYFIGILSYLPAFIFIAKLRWFVASNGGFKADNS